MILKLLQLCFKALDIKMMLQALTQLLQKEVQVLKEEVGKQLNNLLVKAGLWIFVTFLTLMMVFFLLIALASFLNAVLCSRYLGLLIVAGICLLLSCLLILIARVAARKSNRNR